MADEALVFLRSPTRPKIDAILLDIRMPRMDGFEFLEAATAEFGDQFTDIVVIMLTTSVSEADKKRAQSYSVVKEYINKPLIVEHIERINELIN